MSHVFLRCTFGILLLFLALEPEATPTCNEKTITEILRNMIRTDITHLAIEALYNMSCQLERIYKICNVTENLKKNMESVVNLTFPMLKGCCAVDQRDTNIHCHGTGRRKRLCPKCRIKEAVSKFKVCWFQFVRRRPP